MEEDCYGGPEYPHGPGIFDDHLNLAENWGRGGHRARPRGGPAPQQHRPFEYTYTAVEGRLAFLEWAYENASPRVRDGADSYLIEDGEIVAQTIHYKVEHN